LIVEASGHHVVAPVLGWSLASQEYLPAEAEDYFQSLLELNRIRNEHFSEGLAEILVALNREGIRPALLKGAAFLVDDLYPDKGLRLLADLDLLIREDQLQAAWSALQKAGFPPAGPVAAKPSHHHLPGRVHPGTGLSVELHWQPVELRSCVVADAGRCFASASEAEHHGGRALLPSPIERVAHSIIHDKISNRRHRRGVPELRQLLDVAVLRARYEAMIDWVDLRARFRATGQEAVLIETVAEAEVLFLQPKPHGFPDRRSAAERRMRRVLNRGTAARGAFAVWMTIGDAVEAFRQDPRRLLTALRASKRKRRIASRASPW
jgi:hypothetical protein